jgi:lipoprotein-releasing system permease protein
LVPCVGHFVLLVFLVQDSEPGENQYGSNPKQLPKPIVGLPFELALALRYLQPKRTFVSVITLISIIGVTLGVAVLIIVMSVMSGFGQQLRERLLDLNAHLKVSESGKPLSDYRSIRDVVLANEAVSGSAPFIIGPVLVETQPEGVENPQVFTPLVMGVDPELEPTVSSLVSTNTLLAGDIDIALNGLVVGKEFARMLNLGVGDFLAVHSARSFHRIQKAQQEGSETVLLPDDFEVRGVIDTGHYEYNASIVLASIEDAQALYDLGDAVHGLSVKLHDSKQAEPVRQQLLKTLPQGFVVTTWEDENTQILDALKVERNVMFFLLFFVMIVAAFGITSSQITFVVQRTPEIGTLKALGATGWQIMHVFLAQSLVVAILGLSFGFGLAVLALEYRNEFLELLRVLTGFELFPAEIYLFDKLPAQKLSEMGGDLTKIGVGSLFICLLAGVIPAWNASRLKPVEAFRHE